MTLNDNDEKWRQERAENIQIGDVLELEGGSELLVCGKQIGFDGMVHCYGYTNGIGSTLKPMSKTFVLRVRSEEHFLSNVCDFTVELNNLFDNVSKHCMLHCLEDSPGFTKGRFYLVEAEGDVDKFVVDDFKRERTVALLRADHFKVID